MSRLGKSLLSLLFLISWAVYADDITTVLTIYSTAEPGSLSADFYRSPDNNNASSLPGFGIVKIQKTLDLKSGQNSLSFTDIPSLIDPTTVLFKSLTDPDKTTVTQQVYGFDLSNPQQLLTRALGQEITIEQNQGNQVESYKGTLLNTSGGIILEDDHHQLISLNNYNAAYLPNASNNLITQPTLFWTITANKSGKHQTETHYKTAGLTWWVDYNGIYSEGKNANSGFLSLSAWASIMNQSGMNYDQAKLKLIAGEVNQVQTPRSFPRLMAMKAVNASGGSSENSPFSEASLFEYHAYSMTDPITLPNGSTQQMIFLKNTARIAVQKQYIFEGTPGLLYSNYVNTDKEISIPNQSVRILLTFNNTSQAGLGIPLPAGRVRINQSDLNEGSLEFIGEDIIAHTPPDEAIKLNLGNAFDITGKRKQIDFTIDNNRRIMEETIEITLNNHKDQSVDMSAKETLYRAANWEIVKKSGEYQKLDSQTISFPVTLPKNSEAKIQYTVRYTW